MLFVNQCVGETEILKDYQFMMLFCMHILLLMQVCFSFVGSPNLCFPSTQHSNGTEMTAAVFCGAREAAGGLLRIREHWISYHEYSLSGSNGSTQICAHN